MKKTASVVIVALALSLVMFLALSDSISAVTLPVENTWIKKASMNQARFYLQTAVANNKIYAIGGYAPKNGITGTNEEYFLP